ncbi:MAG TPA: acyl-CoA thioesterase [Chitinophagaceae bacterium]|nr:acyl-CoA thioesterase [Chitinophagaceae bacterium]
MQTLLESFYIVRFSDCDPMGHLNNARYLDYMLNAREDHLRDNYQISLPEFAKRGVTWVVTNHEIQYVRPAFYNEKICIVSQVIDAGESYIKVELIMYDEHKQQLKALLWTTFTHIHLKTGKRETHADDFQQFLAGVVVQGIQTTNGLKARLAELLGKG